MNSYKPRILLIDDDNECLNVISKALNLFGYPNEKFPDPLDAMAAFRAAKFDIVITDYKMPAMNGYAILNAVKSQKPDTHVIILSGFADKADAANGLNSKPYAVFCKPLDLKSLIDKISEIKQE